MSKRGTWWFYATEVGRQMTHHSYLNKRDGIKSKGGGNDLHVR